MPRRFFSICILLCSIAIGYAQTVTRYQYWIDDNRIHENTVDLASPSTSASITFAMDLADLREGMHTLYYRMQDNEGGWSLLHTWQFFKTRVMANDEIAPSRIEYWIDTDKQHYTTSSVSNGSITFAMDLADLREGMHTLYYRMQDNEGGWSLLHTWQFFKTRVMANDEIAASRIEYWIDTDKQHYTTSSVSNGSITFAMDLADLREGMHTLYYRIQDNEGGWSALQTWEFFKTRVMANDEIAASRIEYWIDTDKQHYTTSSVSNGSITFAMDLADLREGMHTLYYRIQDNEGGWSLLHTWQFFKTRVMANETIAPTQIEYWIDATKEHYATKPIAAGTASLTMDLADLREGLHTLYYRMQDNEGGWSLLHTWQFFKTRVIQNETMHVVACEYWLDEVTNESTQTIEVSGSSVLLSFSTIGMPTGTHNLYYRFKDDEGVYSPLYIAEFTKINPYDPIMILPYDVTELDADMKAANPDYMAYPTEIESQLPEIKCNNPGE